MQRTLWIVTLLLLVSSALPHTAVAEGDAAQLSNLQKALRKAFKALPLQPNDKMDKTLRPSLPPGVVIEAAPFDALVERLMRPLTEQIDLRKNTLDALSAHASPRVGGLVAKALDTLEKENKDLAKRITAVEEGYAEVFNRGYMESGERQRETRKIAAVLIPLYRRLLFENAEVAARAARVLSEMTDGENLEWLIRAALTDRRAALRIAAVSALAQGAGDEQRAALGKVLAEDDVSSVRGAALVGLMAWPLAQVEDAAISALRDAAWEVRALAIAVCARGRLLNAVGPLIDALAEEEGRLRKDIDDALHTLVGVRMYADVDLWRKWWRENEEQIAAKARELAESGAYDEPLGSVEDWPERENAAEEDAERRGGTSAFYGIPTWSKRILFVVDISRSMDSDAAEAPPITDGERNPFPKPLGSTKMAIARWQLCRAIHDLPKDAVFGLVVYSGSYALWQEGMTSASKGAKTKAYAFIRQIRPNGTTNIGDSMDKALEMTGVGPLGLPAKAKELAADTIFLVSDGDPNRGRLSVQAQILEDVSRRNARTRLVIHAIGIGEAAGSSFLQSLARRNGGRYVGFP